MVISLVCLSLTMQQAPVDGQAVLDKLHAALKDKAAVTFDVVDVSHGRGTQVSSVTIGRNRRYRVKMSGANEMIETPEGSITLMPKKKYTHMSMAGMAVAMFAGFDGMGEPKDYVAANGPAENVVWQKANAVKVKLASSSMVPTPDTVYLDASTNLPLGCEITFQKTHLVYVYKNLKVLDQIDASVFDTTPPKGWSEQKIPGMP